MSLSSSLIKLPFSHGIEVELPLMKSDGSWIDSGDMVKIMPELIKKSKTILENFISKAPDFIKKKIVKTGFIDKHPEKKSSYVTVFYKLPDGGELEICVIGRDSHGVSSTWILELVTPPCEYIQEMQWWLHTLFKTVSEYIENLKGVLILPTGMNPTQEFANGITFGDHHHIGIPDKEVKRLAYNLIRNFIPHLIACSVNSPMYNNQPPKIKKNSINAICSNLPLSHRLKFNSLQLKHVPNLPRSDFDKNRFAQIVEKKVIESRMVDMYPFTKYNTIEIRIFDSQPCILSRLGIMILIQALALKAKKILEKAKKDGKSEVQVPNISKDILKTLRDRAWTNGLTSAFLKDNTLESQDSEFAKIYQGFLAPDFTRKIQHFFMAAMNFIYYVKEEIEEIGVLGTPYIENIGITIFGGNKSVLAPPIPPA
ncbi:MAG: hypothetical protein ACTSQE_15190, partial [Candidatus Heimdallarchaeaceae archaeon]